ALLERAEADHILGYLVKPIKQADLEPVIGLSLRRFEQVEALAREAADLRQALEDRKRMETAKGSVMKGVRGDEDEAFRLASSTTRTVLVVEDNEIAREGLAAVLARAGCAVALAAHAGEALAYLRHYPAPDLILLDMMMPVMDGWCFLMERRRNAALAAIPV